jgi:hypothetical protein
VRLDLKYQFDVSALEVLKHASNLEVLSLWSISDSDDDQTPIVMKNLHTLIYLSSSWGLLHFLTVPALKTLELGYPTGSDRDTLLSLVSRSSCTVQALHLHDQTAEEIIDTLEQFKSLEYLTIQFSDVWDNRISRFHRNGHFEIEDKYCTSVFGFLEKRGQLPALKSLSFIDFPMVMDAALLTSMLDSRRQSHGVANLESFKLVFGQPAEEGYEEAHVSQLWALVDHGLNIHIAWPDPNWKEVNPEMVTFFVVLCMNPTELNAGCSNQLGALTLLLAAHGTYMACRSFSSLPVEI